MTGEPMLASRAGQAGSAPQPSGSSAARTGREVRLDRVTKRFGSVQALSPLSLTVPGGALFSLLGPSGCGKSTTLRLIAGFEQPDEGRILVDGQDISALPPNKRKLGMVFQNYSLFPHMTVAENIAFGLKMAGCSANEIRARVQSALDVVRLSGVGDRYVTQLSGGQQQRIALARSIVTNPGVLLLDEPLGALDKNLRESMQFELQSLQKSLSVTAILVTHDQEEALTMSDLVGVMEAGKLVQVGKPQDVYERPRTRFVAEFLGASNILEARLEASQGREVRARANGFVLEATVGEGQSPQQGGDIVASIRPEKIRLNHAMPPGENRISGRITGHAFRGSYHAFQIKADEIDRVLFAYVSPRELGDAGTFEQGSSVVAHWRPEDVVLLGS